MPLIKPSAPGVVGQNDSAEPPPFVPCPRTAYSAGHQDWLTLTDPRFTNFDVCPTCYEKCIAPTRYAGLFQRSRPKPTNVSTSCDFGNYWVRRAWRYLYWQQHPDVSLLGTVGGVNVPEGSCPTDPATGLRNPAVRKWYSIRHPASGQLLEDFTVCSDCVLHLEIMLPPFRGAFTLASPIECQGTCDLRGPGSRTTAYFTHLFSISSDAQKPSGHLDTTPLADYISLVAAYPECRTRDVTTARPVYTIPTLSDFAICPACYQETISPHLHSRSHPLATDVEQTNQYPNGYICDFYSPRIRTLWTEANRLNSLTSFREKAEERGAKLAETNQQLAPLVKQRDDLTRQMNMYRQSARIAQQLAASASITSIGTSTKHVVDFSQAFAQQARATEIAFQVDTIAARIREVSGEWEKFE